MRGEPDTRGAKRTGGKNRAATTTATTLLRCPIKLWYHLRISLPIGPFSHAHIKLGALECSAWRVTRGSGAYRAKPFDVLADQRRRQLHLHAPDAAFRRPHRNSRAGGDLGNTAHADLRWAEQAVQQGQQPEEQCRWKGDESGGHAVEPDCSDGQSVDGSASARNDRGTECGCSMRRVSRDDAASRV